MVFSTPSYEVCVELCKGQGTYGEYDVEECVRPRKEESHVGCGRFCHRPPVVDLGRGSGAVRENERYGWIWGEGKMERGGERERDIDG